MGEEEVQMVCEDTPREGIAEEEDTKVMEEDGEEEGLVEWTFEETMDKWMDMDKGINTMVHTLATAPNMDQEIINRWDMEDSALEIKDIWFLNQLFSSVRQI
mmetsp:Transcript_29104/g.70994  ORF Transcript_29104/g.70994 Transcript_29104/m.70994 type:complete len:102 (+) Transcript_29104:1556-1861(+)